MAIALAAGAVLGGAIGLIDNGDLPPIANFAGFLLAFAAGGVVIYACLRWWQALDEAAQEAHKWAWWWGGSAGVVVGLIGLLLLRVVDPSGGLSFLNDTAPVGETLYDGAMAVLFFQVGGYVIAWAAWWLRHR